MSVFLYDIIHWLTYSHHRLMFSKHVGRKMTENYYVIHEPRVR